MSVDNKSEEKSKAFAPGEFDGFGEAEYEENLAHELQEQLAPGPKSITGPGGAAWQAATDIVRRVRPVPWLLWTIIRAVYGRSGELGDPAPTAFSVVSGLICRAATDRTLARERPSGEDDKVKSLTEAVGLVGTDVAASLCFMHAVCRRVSTGISERVWRPIIDDALLRAHIGYHVGQLSPSFGPGRGMLAGFAGRSGLAVQIAAGSVDQAHKALSGLAAGVEIGQICREVYKCDPLQVAALSLIAGGCSRDIAMGIAAFDDTDAEVIPGTEQHRWLTTFSVIENLRMGRKEVISQSTWDQLGFDPASINELGTRVQQVQRRGHGWKWITQSLLGDDKDRKEGEAPAEPAKPGRRIDRSETEER